MKNVKNLFGMAVMATALVGCSSNDNLNPNANDNAGKAGEAYASFKINLPTTNGTRAVDPKTGTEFDGGTAAEYEVKNGTILIFDATTDKFVERVELGTMNPWKEDTDNKGVTTAASVTVQLSDVALNGNYNALVLLNNNSETTPKVKLPTTTDTYADWSAKADNANATEYVKTDGIFMANAPKYTGKTTEPTTLVKINKVYASREQAQANSATVVYVERGLAKVTMKDFKTEGYTVANGNTYAGDKVEIKNWKLDVTNMSTFPVHQIGDLSSATTGFADIWKTDRFYDGTNTTFKRVYWGIDPNYSNNELFEGTTAPAKTALKYCEDNFNMITNAQVDGKAGDANPQYCLENTFNLDNMKQGQTTRVVFKAVYTPKTFTTGVTFYKVANNTAVWKEADLKQQIKTVALKAMNITDATEQAKYDVDLSKGSNISGVAGQHLIQEANITYSGTPTDSKVKPAIVNTVNEKLGLKVEGGKIITGISTYLNGEAYYIARIKHFNELTPWTPGDAYGSKNDEYLGRYGVLRNNWYELSVNKVSNLGYPEVPEVKPNVPDDENDKYINVEVKILDWAKRSQSIDL